MLSFYDHFGLKFVYVGFHVAEDFFIGLTHDCNHHIKQDQRHEKDVSEPGEPSKIKHGIPFCACRVVILEEALSVLIGDLEIMKGVSESKHHPLDWRPKEGVIFRHWWSQNHIKS